MIFGEIKVYPLDVWLKYPAMANPFFGKKTVAADCSTATVGIIQ